MLNQQPIIKQRLNDCGSLSVHSIFPTIQGEGPFSGEPALFIRLTGCNLQCPLCDTEYSNINVVYTPDQLMAACVPLISPTKLIVITGGEPFTQNIEPFITLMLSKGYRVQIETNGTLYLDLPYGNDQLTIVCSPKTGKVNKFLQPCVHAYKYVLNADEMRINDGLPLRALGHSAKPYLFRPDLSEFGENTPIYIQPIDVGDEKENKRHLHAAMESSMKFGYTLCIQLHKHIGVE